MMVSVSVPPVSIQLAGGYLNWKPKVEFVKVSQSLVCELGVAVNVAVGGTPGVGVDVGGGGPPGVGVGVGVLPRITRLAPTNGSSVRRLSPAETRALQSMADWPSFKPVRLKVNTVPSVVALLPLLPAIATMKLPFCGPLMATTESFPNKPATEMLITCTRLAS